MIKKHAKNTRKPYYLRAYVPALAALLFLITAALAQKGSISPIEQTFFDLLYRLPDVLTPFFTTVTQAGGLWMMLFVAIALLFLKRPYLSLQIAAIGGLAYLSVEVAKLLINRPRPIFLLANVVQRVDYAPGLGFPSGHTAVATAVSLTLLPFLPRHWRWIVPIWVISVAISRVYLGVHAPLDVIGGFCIGVIFGWFSLHFQWTKRERQMLAKRL